MSASPEDVAALAALVPWDVSLVRSEDLGRTQICVFRAISGRQVDVVAKRDRTWTQDGARSSFEAYGRISQVLTPVDRVSAPKGIVWSSDPPAVVMELAEGGCVAPLLRDAVGVASAWPAAVDAVRLSGKALAALHAGLEAPPVGTRDVVQYAQRMFRPSSSWARRSELPTVHRVSDYTTANQFYSDDHGLALIDPPVGVNATVPHDDVGYYITSLMRSLVGSNSVRLRRPATQLYTALAEEFLNEYSSTGPYDLRGTRDRELVGLIAGYHSANWGWRRRRSWRRGVSLNSLYWAAKSRVVPGAKPWLRETVEH